MTSAVCFGPGCIGRGVDPRAPGLVWTAACTASRAADGAPRRVGVEIEFTGLGTGHAAGILAGEFGGRVVTTGGVEQAVAHDLTAVVRHDEGLGDQLGEEEQFGLIKFCDRATAVR